MKPSKVLMVAALVVALGAAIPAMAANIGNEKDVVPPSPNVYHVGDTINYIITVTNLNATIPMRVDLVQDIFPDGSTASLDPTVPFVLGPGGSRTYSPTWTTTAAGVVVNTSRVVGAQLTTPFEDPFDSSVTKSSQVISPAITIVKTVDCDDDGEYLPVDVGSYGDDGAWRIVVTNTGDSLLTNVMTTDTNGQSFGPTDLAPGASVQYDYVTPGLTETTTNTATVVAEDLAGGTVGPVSSTATNEITISPDIAIVKTVDCDDDGEYLPVDVGSYGDDGAWRIVVTNTGDSPLTNVVTTDTNGQVFGPTTLAPGASVQYDYVTPGLTETTTNTATVTALDVAGGTVGPVSSTATNEITISPAITIRKTVDCDDDGVFLDEDTGTAGDTGHWRIVVTNTGDSPLTNVVTTDTNGQSFGPTDLAPGESVQYDYDTIVNETTTNTATVTAEDVLGGTVGPVSDSATNVVVGGQGCTPGYWKNSPGCWECYGPETLFSSVFSVVIEVRAGGKNTISDPTLMQALEATGGGVNALARHAVAALLNACDDDIAYPMSQGQIIDAVHDAITSGDEGEISDLKNELDMYNNYGCPQSADNAANPCSPTDDEVPTE